MTSFEETSCRLCLKNITDKGFQIIDSVTRDILDVLLLKLKFRGETKEVICNTCNTKLNAAFLFKSMCLRTNNTIIAHVNCEKALQLDLREVYMKENGSRNLTDISYNDKICPLCMKLTKSEVKRIGEEELESIQKFIPEMNIRMIKDLVVCTPCFDSLCTHNTFLNDCLEVEERTGDVFGSLASEIEKDISIFIKNEAGEEFKLKDEEVGIKIECIDIKSEEDERSVSPSLDFNDGPVEPKNEFQSEYVETINMSMLKDEEKQHDIKNENCGLKYRETFEKHTYKNDSCDYETDEKINLTKQQLKHRDVPKKRMYKCDSCDYKTICKSNLNKHQLRHKNIPEEQMYKCESCDYKTIYKHCLIQHKLKHTDIPEKQLHKCDSCDYKTIYKQCLAQHQLRHKGVPEEHMYKCESCGYKTIYKSYFNKHQLRHKDIPDEQMYKCDSCDYKAIYKQTLKKHQLKHKNINEEQMFKCDLCDYKTIYKSNHNKHLLIHKTIPGVQMHICNSCDYKTKQKKCLVQHQLKHKDISEEQM